MKNNQINNTEDRVIKSKAIFKIPAGAASAKAPLGPALGQYGIPIAEFCTRYNTLTEQYKAGTILKAMVTLYEDNTYDITIQNPDAAFFIKMALEHSTNFSTKKNNKIRGKDTTKYNDIIPTTILYEVANQKYTGGLNATYSNVKSLYKSLLGTTRSMGLIVTPSKNKRHYSTKKETATWTDWYNSTYNYVYYYYDNTYNYVYPFFTSDYYYAGQIVFGTAIIITAGYYQFYNPTNTQAIVETVVENSVSQEITLSKCLIWRSILDISKHWVARQITAQDYAQALKLARTIVKNKQNFINTGLINYQKEMSDTVKAIEKLLDYKGLIEHKRMPNVIETLSTVPPETIEELKDTLKMITEVLIITVTTTGV